MTQKVKRWDFDACQRRVVWIKEQEVIAKELAQELGKININDEPQQKENMLFDEVKEDCLLPIWNTAENFCN